jgi:hypothetical protein
LFAVESLSPNDDPGWPRGANLFGMLVPGATLVRSRRPVGDGLVMLRQLVLAFSSAIVFFGISVAFLAEDGPVFPWLGIVAGMAAVSLLMTRVLDRPLSCESAPALAASYRTRFFLRIAFAESVALVAFAGSFSGGPSWIYFAGAAFTLLRFWTIAAPTRAALAREQDALHLRGCSLSLVAALRSPGAPR